MSSLLNYKGKSESGWATVQPSKCLNPQWDSHFYQCSIRTDNCSRLLHRQPTGSREGRSREGIHDWIHSHMFCEGLSACYSRSVKNHMSLHYKPALSNLMKLMTTATSPGVQMHTPKYPKSFRKKKKTRKEKQTSNSISVQTSKSKSTYFYSSV